MSKNKFFRFPYGYIEEKGFESKKTQLKDLLEDNVEVDGMQTKQIESNTAAISAEVERSSTLDEKFGKDLEEEISERKRMGSILNDKLAKLEKDVKGLVGNTSDAFDSVADSLKAVDEELKAKDSEIEKSLEEEVKRAKAAEESLQKSNEELSVRLGKEINAMVESNLQLQEALNNEKTSRETRDSELNAKINVEMAERIAAIELEKLRAETKENEISTSLDTRISTVNSNMTSLANSLSKVNTLIDDEAKRARAEEASLKLMIESESEKNATFQELMSNELTYNLSELKAKDSSLESKINDEVSRAKKEEEYIVTKINNVETSLTNRLNINSDATSVIESRVTSTENKLNNIFLTNTNELEYTLYVGGIPKGTINIPKDNFLKDVVLVNDDLIFTFMTNGVEKTLPVNIGQYVDVYTAGDGLSVHNYKFTLKLDRNGESYLKLTSDGLKVEGINSAIDSAINTYASRVDETVASIKTSIVNEGAIRAKTDEYLESLIGDETRAARDAEDKLNTKLLNIEPRVTNCESKLVILNNEDKAIKSQLSVLEGNIEEVRSEIPSLDGYVTENMLDAYVLESRLAEEMDGVHAKAIGLVEEVRSEIPSLEGYVTETKLAEEIENVNTSIEEVRSEIPSLEGYATENMLDAYVLESRLAEEMDGVYAKAVGLVEEVRSEIPSLEGYATEAKLAEEIEGVRSEIPSLEGYATEAKLAEEISNIQSKVNSIINEEFEIMKQMIIDLQLKINDLENRIYSSQDLIDKLKGLGDGETLSIKLYNDITLTTEDKLTIPTTSVLNLDLNGKTINANFNDILFRVDGMLNINGNGSVIGAAYVASANEGSVVNVENGSFKNEVTTFQANGGTINIYGGNFNTYGETYGAKYTLNHVDRMKTIGLINVEGGSFVNYNPAESHSENPAMNFVNEQYGVKSEKDLDGNTIYTIVKSNKVSTSDDLLNTILALPVGGEETLVELSNDLTIETEEPIVLDGNLSLNLNGYKLVYPKTDILFRVNGSLTINGGEVETSGYIASANEGSTVNVLGGTYNADVTAFQSNGGILNIEGGYFSACNDTYGCKYTLNFIDSKKTIGQINVKGGSFVGYNPAESHSENPAMNFVVEGYKSVETIEDGVTIYVVVKE